MKTELVQNEKLTPVFDNSISALTNYWKYGKKVDATVLHEDIRYRKILKHACVKMKDKEIKQENKKIDKKNLKKNINQIFK